jgi:hypothetical protein
MVVAAGVAIAFVLWIVSFVVIAGVIIAIALLIVTTVAIAPIIATARVMNRLFVATIMAIAAMTTPGIGRPVGRDVQNLARINAIGIMQTIDVGNIVRSFVIQPANAMQGFPISYTVMLATAIRAPGRWCR